MATLDRDAQALLDKMATEAGAPSVYPLNDQEWTGAIRDSVLRMAALSGEPGRADCVRYQIEGDDGPLDLRLYRGAPGVLPALVYFHGGAFVAGSLDTHDAGLRSLAAAAGAVVVAVEYRRAPEHTFPAAAEDCYAAAAYVCGNPERFGIDPSCVVVAGDSAGGTLAACVALMARDRGGPALAGQVCLYPATDLRPARSYPSIAQWDGTFITRAETDRAYAIYLAGADPAHPYASPLLAPDHSRLPAALIVTCECDMLRDEAVAYADRLREAGTAVEHIELPGMMHGIFQLGGVIGATKSMMADVGRWLSGLSAATLGSGDR